MVWGLDLGESAPTVSLMPGGARRQRLTSLDNEEHDKVRNSRRGNAGSARPDRLVHGRYLEDRRGYEALLHSFGGLTCVGHVWSSLLSPCPLSVVQHTSISTEFANNP